MALFARRADRLGRIAEETSAAGGTARAYPVDITDGAALRAAAAAVEDELGPAGIVFNNAGVMLPTAVTQQESEAWHRQIDLNISALNATVHAFSPQLMRSAAKYGVAAYFRPS